MRYLPRLTAAVVGAVLLAGPFTASASAAPNPEAGLSAQVEQSVVSLTMNWAAKVRYPTAGNGEAVSDEIDLTGHCVDPAEVKNDFIDAALAAFFKAGRLTGSVADNQAYAYQNWTPEGASKGSPPIVQVRVDQSEDVNGPVRIKDKPAQIVAVDPTDQGDISLLKLANVTGTVSSVQTSSSGIPRIEVSAELSPGMSGGPTVDASGNVVGVNSRGFGSTGQGAFNFITDPSRLVAYMSAHGITPVSARVAVTVPSGQPAPGPLTSPVAAKSGGFPGWLVALLVVLMLGLVAAGAVHVRRNRRHQPTPAAWGQRPVGDTQSIPPARPTMCPQGHENARDAAFCNTCGAAIQGL